MADRFGDAADELLRKIDKLEEANGALCEEINRQERRIRKLESLLVDVWPYVWALRIPGRRDEEFEERFEELGLEVES